jgi:hypothetical protein
VADDICAISTTGDPWCWGGLPQFGSTISHATAGRPVKLSPRLKSLEGAYTICGIAEDDYAYCLVKNNSATTLESLFTLSRLNTPFHVRSITTSEYFGACAISADDGLAYCWGNPIDERLGDPSGRANVTVDHPVEVAGQRASSGGGRR